MTAIKPVALYAIAADLDMIGEELMANGGELTPDLEARLDAATETFARKVEQYGSYRLSVKAAVTAIGQEEERLRSRRKAMENGIARMDEYFIGHMEAQDRLKVKTPLLTVSAQKSPPSWKYEGEFEDMPDAVREPVDPLPPYRFSGMRAAEYYKTHGETLPDGVTRHQGRHLRVR